MLLVPNIDLARCTQCNACIDDCVAHAISPKTMEIDAQRCIACGHCVAICPVAAAMVPKGSSVPTIQELKSDAATQFENLLQGMRSIRHYQQKPLAKDDIQRIADLVRYAPTGTNAQSICITVLNSRSAVKSIADGAMAFFRPLAKLLLNRMSYPLLGLTLGFPMAQKLLNYRMELDQYAQGTDILTHNAHSLFIFHAPKGGVPEQDAPIWAQTAALYARTLGIGICYNGFLVRALNAVARLRRRATIPRGNRIYVCFTAGYSNQKYRRGVQRCAPNLSVVD